MQPGRSVNYYFGWAGLSLMVIMNVYMIRKRAAFMRKWGRLQSWLNFHIFCGLLGPTLIVFHSGFKVRGLVGISFWSMVISASSGVVGRYFFGQVSRSKKDLQREIDSTSAGIARHLSAHNISPDGPEIKKHERRLHNFVGAGANTDSLISVLMSSLAGDLRLLVIGRPQLRSVSDAINDRWVKNALLRRKVERLEAFETLMSYWHLFHTPFAVFMYLAAVIHVISAMIFLVQ